MLETSGGIHDAADGGGYLAHAVLDENALDSIREANVAFLVLVGARHGAARGAVYGLTAASAAAIAALDAAGRRTAASCPYSLFNLSFEDATFWHAIALDPVRDGRANLTDEAAFARTAVFLAWHLAQSSELTAQLVLGLSDAGQRAWRGLPLSALDRVATAALPRLAARWGDHPVFWPKLLAAGAPVGRVRADSVRLLGLQLLAADGIRADPPRA